MTAYTKSVHSLGNKYNAFLIHIFQHQRFHFEYVTFRLRSKDVLKIKTHYFIYIIYIIIIKKKNVFFDV